MTVPVTAAEAVAARRKIAPQRHGDTEEKPKKNPREHRGRGEHREFIKPP
jgi:hypothetical protein